MTDVTRTATEILEQLTEENQEDIFSQCAQCGAAVRSIKGDSHNYCQNCGFRDSCC